MGFPVLTVTESPNGISIRQDRFLESGVAADKDNETIWWPTFNEVSGLLYTNYVTYRTVPLFLLSVGEDGKARVDKSAILTEREKSIAIDTSKPFKLNADTNGVCKCTCGVLIFRIWGHGCV